MMFPNEQGPSLPTGPLQQGPTNNRGLIQFTGNAEIDQMKKEGILRAQGLQSQPVILNLAGHVRTKWNAAREAKSTIEDRMRKNLRQRKGEYEPSDLAKIRAQGGTEVFVNLTNVKCRGAESWLFDIHLPPGERPWSADPTPIPDLPPDVQEEIQNRVMGEYQQAMMLNMQLGMSPQELQKQVDNIKSQVVKELKRRAEEDSDKLEDLIDDELVDGEWYEAVREVIPDIVTHPAGIMMGPVVKMKKVLQWFQYPNGEPFAQVVSKPVRTYMRVSPFDIYPSPGARTLQDGYLCHRIKFERKDLVALMGVEGFSDDSIRMVLDQYGAGGLREWLLYDTERDALENKPPQMGGTKSETIDCLKFMGPVQGVMLRQWGMGEKEVPDPLLEYEVEAYLIGSYIIGAKLNPHPLGKRNYFSASFDKSNDSPWGKGVPELMEDVQRICNGAARALVNNMAHASGPMGWVYQNRVAEGEQVTGVRPWKIWRMMAKATDTGSRPPMGWFQPRSIVNELLKLYDYFYKQASETTGIPSYVYGSTDNIGGAGKTASGLSMLMNAASKALRAVAGHIDAGIIKKSINEHWLSIMLYEPEKAIGDIKIVARASEYLIMMEQLQIRRMEFLNTTNNPTDMQIIGIDGRAEVLREAAKALKMPVDRIIPDREDIVQNMDQAMMQMVIQNIAQGLQLPIEFVAQLAQQGGMAGQGGGQPGQPNSVAPDGGRTGGQDFRLAA